MSARIVFDLDGTLIDSAPDLHGIANTLLAAEGRAPISLAEARDFIGNGAPVFVAKMCRARDLPESEQPRLLSEFVGRYPEAVARTEPYPQVRETLAALQAAGHKLGVCTNKPIAPTLAVLRHLDLAHFFDVILGGDSLPVHKPDPAPLHAAFDALGTGPTLYVGDSDVDAETAARAVVPFLLFSEGYRKCPVAELPHTAAFNHFNALPHLIAAQLEPAA